MALGRSERQTLRREFTAMAGEAFDAMFDDDQQEQLITVMQREDRVLEKGAEPALRRPARGTDLRTCC